MNVKKAILQKKYIYSKRDLNDVMELKSGEGVRKWMTFCCVLHASDTSTVTVPLPNHIAKKKKKLALNL